MPRGCWEDLSFRWLKTVPTSSPGWSLPVPSPFLTRFGSQTLVCLTIGTVYRTLNSVECIYLTIIPPPQKKRRRKKKSVTMDVTMGNAGPVSEFWFYVICFFQIVESNNSSQTHLRASQHCVWQGCGSQGSQSRKELAARQGPGRWGGGLPRPVRTRPRQRRCPPPRAPTGGGGETRRPKDEGVCFIS